jgi:hypothetical protein
MKMSQSRDKWNIETSEKGFLDSYGGIFCDLQIFLPQKAQKTQRKLHPLFVFFVPFVAEIIPWDYSEVSYHFSVGFSHAFHRMTP